MKNAELYCIFHMKNAEVLPTFLSNLQIFLDKIIDNINNGVYKIQYKDNNFSIPKYYSKKFEELLDPDILEQMKKYNNMIADNFTYKNIMISVDVEEQNLYNESVVSQRKKKRGF